MALTGYEKLLKDYTKEQLIEIAESYSVYYTTSSGKGKLSGYRRLTKEQLVYYSNYAFKKFYFRPRIIWNYIRKIKSLRLFGIYFEAFKGFLSFTGQKKR